MDRRVGISMFLCLFATCQAHITNLMYSCSGLEDQRCQFTSQDYASFHSPAYKLRLFNLISSGIPHIFWNEIASGTNFTNIPVACITSLELWKGRMLAGEEEALSMLDSSGKFPTASMMKTAATLGDYDQCLSIDSAQFCALEMFPKQTKKSLWGRGVYSLDQKVMSQDTGLIQAMCLPADACSSGDIKSLVHQIMSPYLMTAEPGFITCDTRESISWKQTFSSFSIMQWTSLAYLLLMTMAVAIGTGLHVFHLLIDMQSLECNTKSFLITFSALDAAERVFYVRESYFWDPRRLILDLFKAFSVSFTAISHSYAVIGAPLAFYLFDSQEKFSSFMRQPLGLTMTNEAGISIFMVLSGFLAFQLMYPLAKVNKLPFFLALLDRILKFLPAMAAIVSIEIIWPILGSGPLYSRFSEFNLERCSRGWTNLLFLNNWVESVDICAPQTFFAAIVIQVFVISLIVTKVLLSSEKRGVQLCWFLIFGSSMWMSVNAWRYNVTPTLFNHYPKAQDIVDHVTAVHTHFSSSCFAYFTGFLCGFYVLEKGIKIDVSSGARKLRWIAFMIFLTSIPNLLVIANASGLVDRKFSALFILANRGSLIVHTGVFLVFLYSVSDFSLFQRVTGTQIQTKEDCSPVSKKFSLLAAFHRLALGIFFTNMTIVHYEVFTRRRLVTYDILSVLSRSLFTLVSVLISSFLFTIVFIHPVERLIGLLRSKTSQKKE